MCDGVVRTVVRKHESVYEGVHCGHVRHISMISQPPSRDCVRAAEWVLRLTRPWRRIWVFFACTTTQVFSRTLRRHGGLLVTCWLVGARYLCGMASVKAQMQAILLACAAVRA